MKSKEHMPAFVTDEDDEFAMSELLGLHGACCQVAKQSVVLVRGFKKLFPVLGCSAAFMFITHISFGLLPA